MPHPPRGFEEGKHPLRHKMYYTAGLSLITATQNTAHFPVVRYYKTVNDPDTIDVNPKHASYDKETGPMCSPQSIIDRMKINITLSLTKIALSKVTAIRCWWQPIINAFPEKLDAADDFTGDTVASLLKVTKDATEEDVTPSFSDVKFTVVGSSDRLHPLSTVNKTETIAHANLDTDATAESVGWNDENIKDALLHYTNKGALRSCLGRRRYVTLTEKNPIHSFYIDKPVPRAIRRMVPYSYMGILIHLPVVADNDQIYQDTDPTAAIAYVGATVKIKYNEWNSEHNQDRAG